MTQRTLDELLPIGEGRLEGKSTRLRAPRREVPGAFNVFVAPTGDAPAPSAPLPVPAASAREAEEVAAVAAGVTTDQCLALPAREGDWVEELMAAMEEETRRTQESIDRIRRVHAQILGCTVDELDARIAAEEAERPQTRTKSARRRAPKVPFEKGEVPSSSGSSAGPAPCATSPSVATESGQGALPMTRLTERQRELLALVRVENNVAIYTGTERIPDWASLKKVMVALGGTWRRDGFRFADDVDGAELVRLAQATGEILDPRMADFFPTPDFLADRIVELAEIRPGHHVLEPSAGRGAIARAVRRACPEATLTCVELLPDHVAALRAEGFTTVQGDFLPPPARLREAFDRVVMNPPFGGRADIRHVYQAHSCLRMGGRLVSVMSAGVAYRQDRMAREFRAFLDANAGRIEENPDGSFAEAGTMVRTVTIVMTKGGG